MIDNHPKPRWGNLRRSEKAMLIFKTIYNIEGDNITRRKWLDVGCGSGGIAATIAKFVSEIEGIDPEPWCEWQDQMQENNNLELKVGIFDKHLPNEYIEQYDVIICNQVYEHVDNPVQLIKNIKLALKPNGICYFAGPNLLWPIEPHLYWPFIHWLPRSFALKLINFLGSKKILDANSLSSWQLIDIFNTQNFEIETILAERIVESWPNFRRLKPLMKKLFDTFLPFSPSFIFILRKK